MKNIDSAKFTVIIVTYNSSHCISKLSNSLKKLENIIVVDNGSDDDIEKELTQSLPQALLIKNLKNIGFGAANNCALNIVSTPYALLINPDCIPTMEFLAGMLQAANNFPQAAIIAPHLIRKNGKPEISYRWPAIVWKSKGLQAEGPCCVGFVCGAAMLLNMEVMKEVGFFDETFFLYYEDEDLCQRVFMQHKQIVLVPTVKITHLSRGSVKGPNPLKSEFIRGFHHAQSKLVFENKHYGAHHASLLRWQTLFFALLMLVPRMIIPQPRYLARLFGRIIGLCLPYPNTAKFHN
jgi:GT2 family glycosyltransferase